MQRSASRWPALVVAAALAGCAALTRVTSDVATYSEWPAAASPAATPSSACPRSRPTRRSSSRTRRRAARRALETAGFTRRARCGTAPTCIVQLGARISRTEVSPWDDPLWWRWRCWLLASSPPGGRARARRSTAGFNAGWYSTRYEREVALLLRDRASGTPLYEAHAQQRRRRTSRRRGADRRDVRGGAEGLPGTGASTRGSVTVQRCRSAHREHRQPLALPAPRPSLRRRGCQRAGRLPSP